MWLLEFLALALLHFPLLLGMGLGIESMCSGCHCAICTGATVCSAAICSNGGPIGTPCDYQAELAGFADDDCAANNCAVLDGTYTLTVDATCRDTVAAGTQPNAAWFGSCTAIATPPQKVAAISFGATMVVEIIYGTGVAGQNNKHTFVESSSVDCASLDAHPVPFATDEWGNAGTCGLFSPCPNIGTAACTGSAATCLVTCLP